MTDTTQASASSSDFDQIQIKSNLFKATVGRFKTAADRNLIDDVTHWVEETYREDLALRPSKHVYLRSLPASILAKIDALRESEVILGAIAERFNANSSIIPMQETDELYISHYNKDYGGDHGLFSKHYDGNMRFLPVGTVVRALIYLQSDATYKVVFGDSKVEHAFVTYEFGLLDFHRELHWVEGKFNPTDKQRIMLKCNYLVAPKNAIWISRSLLAVNKAIFYVVKAAMEYSKSPKTPAQYAIGYLCNIARLLNNINPLLPLAFVAAAVIAATWALVKLLF